MCQLERQSKHVSSRELSQYRALNPGDNLDNRLIGILANWYFLGVPPIAITQSRRIGVASFAPTTSRTSHFGFRFNRSRGGRHLRKWIHLVSWRAPLSQKTATATIGCHVQTQSKFFEMSESNAFELFLSLGPTLIENDLFSKEFDFGWW